MAKYNSVTGKLPKGGGKGLSGDALVGKVSQATIDDIKRMGMTKALKLAGKNGPTAGGMAREFQEGVRRMYGAKRLADAKSQFGPKPKLGTKTVMAPPGGNRPAAKPASKESTKSKVIKGTLGTAAAVGLLAASRGRGASVAARLSPAVAKVATKSAVGRAVFGTSAKMTPAMIAKMSPAKAAAAKVTVGPKGSFGKTTLQQAKSKLGTPSEYASKAAQDAARKTPAKTNVIKPRSTNTPAKPMPKTAKGKANYGKYGTRDEYLFERNADAARAAASKPAVKKAVAKKKIGKMGAVAGTSMSNKKTTK